MEDQQVPAKLSGAEKFIGLMVLVIGIGMLIMEVLSIISSKTSIASQAGDAVTIKMSELLSHIRYFLIAAIASLAAILFFGMRPLGWVMSFGLLLVSSILAGYLAYISFYLLGITTEMYASLFLLLVMLLPTLLLFRKRTRIKYKVGKFTFLPTVVFLLALGAIFIFLQ